MPFQKDFYKEHPSVTARSHVSVVGGVSVGRMNG